MSRMKSKIGFGLPSGCIVGYQMSRELRNILIQTFKYVRMVLLTLLRPRGMMAIILCPLPITRWFLWRRFPRQCGRRPGLPEDYCPPGKDDRKRIPTPLPCKACGMGLPSISRAWARLLCLGPPWVLMILRHSSTP